MTTNNTPEPFVLDELDGLRWAIETGPSNTARRLLATIDRLRAENERLNDEYHRRLNDLAARIDHVEQLERERWERDAVVAAKADELAAKVIGEAEGQGG